ncbi:MAG: DUF6273 domain-containing protein [Bacillota bacterium]
MKELLIRNLETGEIDFKIEGDFTVEDRSKEVSKNDLAAYVKVGARNAGEKFQYANKTWVVMEHVCGGTFCLSEEILFEKCFDEDNSSDWSTASLRKYLNDDFIKELVKDGASVDDLLAFSRDLTSDDGLKTYCKDIVDKVSLISCEEYRDWRANIPAKDDWWWTLTPYSTSENSNSYFVRYVSSSGTLKNIGAYSGGRGVAPLLYLKSDTEVLV